MTLPAGILAGGLATRLQPITEHIPKSLIEVAGRPFAEHQIELLRARGVTEIVFMVGHLGEMVRDAIGDGTRWGIRVRYAFDGERPLGTGGAVRGALSELGESFFVIYGDSYLDCDYGAIERAFFSSGKMGLMTVFRNDDKWDRSNVLFDGGRVLRYDKAGRTPDMQHIDYGLGVFHRSAFDARPAGDTFDLAAVYQDLLARGDLAGFEVHDRFFEIGSHAGLEETAAHIAQKNAIAGRERSTR